MAQLTVQENGDLLVILSDIERLPMSDPECQRAFAEYCTLWIEQKTREVFNDRFKTLSQEDKQIVLSKFSRRG